MWQGSCYIWQDNMIFHFLSDLYAWCTHKQANGTPWIYCWKWNIYIACWIKMVDGSVVTKWPWLYLTHGCCCVNQLSTAAACDRGAVIGQGNMKFFVLDAHTQTGERDTLFCWRLNFYIAGPVSESWIKSMVQRKHAVMSSERRTAQVTACVTLSLFCV